MILRRSVVGVLALVLCGSACSGGGGKQSSATTTTTTVGTTPTFDVPWVDQPYPRYVPATPVSTTLPPANARPCTASDVVIGGNNGNGAGGVSQSLYAVTNVSSTTCMLGGYPPAVLATQPGLTSVAATDGSEFPFEDPGPAGNVAPGKSGALSMLTSRDCAAGQRPPLASQTYHHLVVTLPGGGQTVVNAGFDVVCGIVTSRFGVIQPQAIYPRAWYAGLTASLTAPDTVNAGSTLTYVVTLGNPTTRAAGIDPCPGYIEHLSGAQLSVITGHGLNCHQVHQIPASGGIRYEMRLLVPNNAPNGTATIQWMIDGPDAPQARTTLLITARDEK